MSTNALQCQQVTGKANYMSEKEANSLIQKYDKNGDSILTKEELTALIIDQAAASQQQQQKPKKEEVLCKPQKVEAKDEKGPLKLRFSRDDLREIFLEHDIDGDGYLNRSELIKAFNMCGSWSSFNKANYALNLADADGDGLINLHELEKVLDYAEKLNNLKK